MDKRSIQDFTADYINSYNVMIEKINKMLKNMRACDADIPGNDKYSISVNQLRIRSPVWHDDTSKLLYPWECRRSHLTYEGTVTIQIGIAINGVHTTSLSIPIGAIPIMVKSKLCNLADMTPEELIKHNEEDDELGGYFIVKGNQAMMRYLVQTRRNFPILKFRDSADKKANRTGHVITMNCIRDDETIAAMTLHWNSNTAPDLGLQINSKSYFIPLPYILKALVDKSPMEIFNDIPKSKNDISLTENLCMMFDKFNSSNENFRTQNDSLEYLGNFFRGAIRCSKSTTNVDVGKLLLHEYIAIHLSSDKEKYDLLLMMLLKLHSFVNNNCCEESFDTLNFQDILSPGSIYMLLLKKSLETSLVSAVRNLPRIMAGRNFKTIEEAIKSSFKDSGKALSDMNYFMSTGNIRNGIIAGIKQSTGLRITVDIINFYRYVANFRAFHRGAFFTTMKTSAIRRLLPESWGFVCPVHTPDGTPCGLLNHFSINTKVQTEIPSQEQLANLDEYLRRCTISVDKFRDEPSKDKYISVMCDGRVIGYLLESISKNFSYALRKLKVIPSDKPIPSVTEIVLVNKTDTASQFPGLYIFTSPGRLLRPVYNIMFGKPIIEYIGTFEQTYLDISCRNKSISDGGDMHAYTTHAELSPESIYSFTASFTPYQNHNPSPRNLYQCQMSKQSMGFSYYSERYRADNKLYCFLGPQIPLCRSKTYDEYKMEKRPLGYNPIVAVTSYTGYDMEDAMVINKNSLQRGMGRCRILKNYCIDLNENKRMGDVSFFGCGDKTYDGLDWDGLPAVGMRLYPGKSVVYASHCPQTRTTKPVFYKEKEIGYVVNVSLNTSWSKATICISLARNTVIGDKFASRHGQKGINSLQMAAVDLPYNEDGITPDQLFNPHGFPSRMTAGKLIEFVAAKLAALSATVIDSTAFQDESVILDYIDRLKSYHYEGHGNERMLNGYSGRMMDSPVNMSIIYYQRLRHLVDDKYQVRSVGKVDVTTRQPLKGRKIGGGIRLGEMERDGLLSHGAVMCLQDRMVDCSPDSIVVNYCQNCRSFVHSYFRPAQHTVSWMTQSDHAKNKNSWQCRLCESSDSMQTGELKKSAVPAVTRHLFHELASMNIRVNLTAVPIDDDDYDQVME